MVTTPTTFPSGTLVAVDVPAEVYLRDYAGTHHEWVRGSVIQMTPVSLQHTALVDYLRDLLRTYFTLTGAGRVLGEPFVMALETSGAYREPDLQVILEGNPGRLTETAMHGPADLCVEVVSAESVARDYGDKFEEYEKGGVREYWIIDPLRQEAHFYALQPSGLYARTLPDAEGIYRTPLVPRLALHVPTLWGDPLPTIVETVQAVQAMVGE